MPYLLAVSALLLLATILYAARPPKFDAPALDLLRLREALRQVENWDGYSRGAAGERGPYQFTPTTWTQVSKKPFAWAEGFGKHERDEQDRAALAYLTWLRDRLTRARIPADPYHVALAYTAGYEAVRRRWPHLPTPRKHDYAERATTLYHALASDPRFQP